MDLTSIIFKGVILLGPLVGFTIGIIRSGSFWPLAFFTFFGSAITAINFRIAGILADLEKATTPAQAPGAGDLYRLLAWLLCPPLLLFGLRKIQLLRRREAIEALRNAEE